MKSLAILAIFAAFAFTLPCARAACPTTVAQVYPEFENNVFCIVNGTTGQTLGVQSLEVSTLNITVLGTKYTLNYVYRCSVDSQGGNTCAVPAYLAADSTKDFTFALRYFGGTCEGGLNFFSIDSGTGSGSVAVGVKGTTCETSGAASARWNVLLGLSASFAILLNFML
eukprot:ANDGO_07411.mRNA.1 hypothetical protein